jgi:hypothetical protein
MSLTVNGVGELTSVLSNTVAALAEARGARVAATKARARRDFFIVTYSIVGVKRKARSVDEL